MPHHYYNTKTIWTGNRGHGTSEYKAYDRSHIIRMKDKTDIQGSSDAAFRGDKTKHTPEELFVSTLINMPHALVPSPLRGQWRCCDRIYR